MRILVARLSALGDVIHTIPAVSLLTPVAEVSWIVEEPYAELVQIVTGATTIPVRLKRWSRSPVGSRDAAAEALRSMRGFEVAVDFQGLIKSAGLVWLSRAPLRFGFDADAIREKAALAFTNRKVSIDRTQHVVDWNRQLAQAVMTNREPAPEQWTSFASDPHHKTGRYAGRIVLLPGAGKPNKLWSSSGFRAIVDRYPGRTVVAWGPGERHLAEAIGGDIAPETNLRELAALLGRASAVVGADTGPIHLAAAMGVRVVGLYAPTDPRRNGPYGRIDSTIDHYRSDQRTMQTIRVEEVLAKLEEVLG